MSEKKSNQQVRAGEELPEDALRHFLHDQELIKDPNSPLEVAQFSHGFSNLTYLLKIENQEMVLRRPPFGATKRGHDMGREYKVLSKLHHTFPKAPPPFAYTEDLNIIGAPFYIMKKMDGIILTYKEAVKRNIPADQFKVIANSWLDTFVELHQVDYEATGLSDLGRPAGYVERQVTNWGKQYLKAATEDIPEATKIMAWMEANQPREYDYCLIHNDYKYDNVVFKDDSWQEVHAVLDWEMCTLGDPLMDLGTSIAYWTMESDGDLVKRGIPSPTSLPGNPGRHDMVESYARKSGRSINHLGFYYVYGLFKIAVIAQQIYYRYQKGLTKDPRFATLNQAARLLCVIGWQAIQKKKIERLF